MTHLDRRTYCFVVLLVALLSVAGCGDDSTDNARPSDDGQMDAGKDAVADDVAESDASDTITVSGQVVRTAKSPVGGIQVGLLSGRNAVSDADGTFRFDDVEPPYDLVTITRRQETIGMVYRGLETPTPTIHHPIDFESTHGGSIDGSVSGNGSSGSSPGNRATIGGLFPVGDSVEGSFSIFSTNPGGAYSTSVDWFDASSVTVRAAALGVTFGDDNQPTGYTNFGRSSEISINDGDALSQVSVPLSTSVSGVSRETTLSAPNGYQIVRARPIGLVDGTPALRFPNFTSKNTALTFPRAESLSAGLNVRFDADRGSGSIATMRTGVEQRSGPLEIHPSLPPTISQPANNATGVDDSTTFAWENYADGVHLLGLLPDGTSDAPSLFIATDESSASIPELTGFGFSLPAETDYQVRVFGAGPANGIDDAASDRWADVISYATVDNQIHAPYRHTFTIVGSDTRTVTTSPDL